MMKHRGRKGAQQQITGGYVTTGIADPPTKSFAVAQDFKYPQNVILK